VGGVVKVARNLIGVFPCVSGTVYIKEIELSAVESPSSECTGCCDARTNTEFILRANRTLALLLTALSQVNSVQTLRILRPSPEIHVKMRWVRSCVIKVVLDLLHRCNHFL
jgi:hypothetical protein